MDLLFHVVVRATWCSRASYTSFRQRCSCTTLCIKQAYNSMPEYALILNVPSLLCCSCFLLSNKRKNERTTWDVSFAALDVSGLCDTSKAKIRDPTLHGPACCLPKLRSCFYQGPFNSQSSATAHQGTFTSGSSFAMSFTFSNFKLHHQIACNLTA